jgi:AcrR family transcriptional regulator
MSPKVSEEHKQSRRKEILNAAKRVFARKGYERSTMKDIVEEVGMSRGGVYMYFSSTEDMMLALIEEEDRKNFERLDAIAAESGAVWDTLVSLIRGGEHDIDQMASGFANAVYEFYLTRRWNEHHVPLLEKRYHRALTSLTQYLQKGVDSGEFRPLIPLDDIARVIISMMDGLTLIGAHLGPERIKLHAQMEAFIIMLKSVLQVQPSKSSEER